MRWTSALHENIFERIESGRLIGDLGAPNGRVTVEPSWQLRTTSPVYANSTRGPYRYWYDENRIEYEVPSIQNISISRPPNQDFGTCTITIYNAWHESNEMAPELAGQFGKPGYFWPKRGVNDTGAPSDAGATWNQSPGTGAYRKDGTWEADFSWRNVLVDDAMIRTYQGYGGVPKDHDFKSIQQNVDDSNIVLTGVWLVDSVVANSSGIMILNCRDVGRLLLDQIVFPPTIPSALYPLEYVPPGRSAFNSTWGPLGRAPSSTAGSLGPVKIAPTATSSDAVVGDPFLADHPIEAAIDGDQRDYFLTEAFDKRFAYPDSAYPDYSDTAWVEFVPTNSVEMSMIEITPWAGGYRVYASVEVNGSWAEGEHKENEPDVVPSINPAEQIEYVSRVYIPETNPGGDAQRGEQAIFINLSRKVSQAEADFANGLDPSVRERYYGFSENVSEGQYVQFTDVTKIRLSFQRFYYSGMPNNDGDQYRAGIRTLKAFCAGQNNNPYDSDIRNVSLSWTIQAHPTRGYWVLENAGTMHGFGDAYFDSDSLDGDPQVNMNNVPWALGQEANVNRKSPRHYTVSWRAPQPINNNTAWDYNVTDTLPNEARAHDMACTPSGDGYWVVDWLGNVNEYGDAQFYGSYSNMDRYRKGEPFVDMYGHPYTGLNRLADWRAGQPSRYPNRTPLGYTDPVTGSFVCQAAADTNPMTGCVGIAATHTGEGYWTLFGNGQIVAFGDAIDAMTHMNGVPISARSLTTDPDPFTGGATYPMRIYDIPDTATTLAMDEIWKRYFAYGRVSYGYRMDYQRNGKGAAIAAHPTKIGCIVTDDSGQVFTFGQDMEISGQASLINRTYNPGGQNEFSLKLVDRAQSIEMTDTGKGYWILFNSGQVAPFGDAVDKGPLDLQTINKEFEDNVAVKGRYDAEYYKKLYYGIARDQDGRGYWTLRADGEVYFYESTDWGNPGWHNLTGYRWHEGNFTGDWAQIAKEVAMWAGFTYYERAKDSPSLNPTPDADYENVYVLGNLETTAIEADVEITGDKWDKRAIIDIIRELAEVTGYVVRIDQEGGLRYESPNWWRSGNFDYNGQRIWVVEAGDQLARLPESGEGWTAEELGGRPFIPVIHETKDMMAHSATLSNADKRWQIIIGTDTPDPRDIDRTAHVQHFPPFSNYELTPGVPAMRGIPRTAIWTSHVFENAEERQLMAEMIGIHNYFAARTSTTTAVANPCIDLQDQVRLVERTSSETFIHRVIGITTEMNLEDGTYTMDLQTHWLGSADDWVLVTTAEGAPWDLGENPDGYNVGNRVSYNGSSYISLIANNTETPTNASAWSEQAAIDNPLVVISERLDSWQTETQRQLQVSGYAQENPYIMQLTGEFNSMTSAIDSNGNPSWGLWYTGTSVEAVDDDLLVATGDVLDMSTDMSVFPYVNYKSFGQGTDTGLNWPFLEGNSGAGYSYEDNGLEYSIAKARNASQSWILTLGGTPDHLRSGTLDLYDVTATTSVDAAVAAPSITDALGGGSSFTAPFIAEFTAVTNPVAAMAWEHDVFITDTYDYEISGVTLTNVVIDSTGAQDVTFMIGLSDGGNDFIPLSSATVTGAGAAYWTVPNENPNVLYGDNAAGTEPATIELTIDMLEVQDMPSNPGRLVLVVVPSGASPVRPASVTIDSVEFHYTEVLETPEVNTGVDNETMAVNALPVATTVALDSISGPSVGNPTATHTINFGALVDGGSGAAWYVPAAPTGGYELRGVRLENVAVSAPSMSNALVGIGLPDYAGGSVPGSGRANNDSATPTDAGEDLWFDGADTFEISLGADPNSASVATFATAATADEVTLYVDSPTPVLSNSGEFILGIGTFATGAGGVLADSITFDSITWLWYLPRP